MVRALVVVIVAAAAATAACSLNPQPLPPEDNGFGADAGMNKDSSPTTADGAAPGVDGGTDLDGAVLDARADASDAADAADASDASDAGDAAEDAVTE